MNLIGLVFGSGKKAKLARHRMEQNWNRFDEPIIHLFKWPRHGMSKKRSITYREKRINEANQP